MVNSTFDSAKTGFEIALGLTGVLTLWLGLMKVGERGGAIGALARVARPFFRRLFPGVPADHPAHGSIIMNFAANMLGLDNAATPLGLKAMQELQELNPDADTATNAQIMFLVLNTSGLTVIPISIMVYRAQLGAANPTDVFLPILLATYFSTIAGLIAVAIVQRINLLDPVVLAYLLGVTGLVAATIAYFSGLPQDQVQTISNVVANVTLFGIIAAFIAMAALRRINVYDAFIEGAKEGFAVAIRIIPYLIAILVAIGVFRASGALDLLVDGIGQDGHGARASLRLDSRAADGADEAAQRERGARDDGGRDEDARRGLVRGRLASTMQGASDTTFYIIALYFGSVGVRKTRHAVACGLIADFAGVIAAIFIAYIFWS